MRQPRAARPFVPCSRRNSVRRFLPLSASILLSFAFLTQSVSAEPPYLATCGVVRAFTAATASANGSVTIGTSTFALRASDRLPAASPVGLAMCINRTVTTAGPVLELIAMPSPVCGEILGLSPAIPGQRGAVIDIVTTTPDLRIALAASASLRFTFPDRSTVACLEVGLDATGTAVASRVMGATVTVPATMPGPVTRLPSTATDARSVEVVLIVAATSAAVAFLGAAALHRVSPA